MCFFTFVLHFFCSWQECKYHFCYFFRIFEWCFLKNVEVERWVNVDGRPVKLAESLWFFSKESIKITKKCYKLDESCKIVPGPKRFHLKFENLVLAPSPNHTYIFVLLDKKFEPWLSPILSSKYLLLLWICIEKDEFLNLYQTTKKVEGDEKLQEMHKKV